MAVSTLQRFKFRKIRVRNKVSGTSERPRLSVYRSLKNIYAQIIDDTKGQTLVAASTLSEPIQKQKSAKGGKDAALQVGRLIAELAVKKNIKRAVFDRGGRQYHGCIKAVADGAREKGLEF